MLEELEKAYEALQRLEIQPTRDNILILGFVLDVLQAVYLNLKKKESEGKK